MNKFVNLSELDATSWILLVAFITLILLLLVKALITVYEYNFKPWKFKYLSRKWFEKKLTPGEALWLVTWLYANDFNGTNELKELYQSFSSKMIIYLFNMAFISNNETAYKIINKFVTAGDEKNLHLYIEPFVSLGVDKESVIHGLLRISILNFQNKIKNNVRMN